VKRCVLFLIVLGSMVAPMLLSAQDQPPRLVFNGGNEIGEVWANVGLTLLRLEEDYIPIVVAVVNRSREPVIIDRDAIRLVGRDGTRYPMPTLEELRKGYRRSNLDGRAVSAAGIPWEVWQRERKLMESNFFPILSSSRRAMVIDEVTLAPGYALVDLFYFAKPKGLAPGEPFLIEVESIGWEAPVRLGIVLN